MENETGTRREPQTFLLPERGFSELQQVQITLNLMAHIARGDAKDLPESITVTMGRTELYRVLMQLSEQISDVLDQVWNEHWFSGQYRARQ